MGSLGPVGVWLTFGEPNRSMADVLQANRNLADVLRTNCESVGYPNVDPATIVALQRKREKAASDSTDLTHYPACINSDCDRTAILRATPQLLLGLLVT